MPCSLRGSAAPGPGRIRDFCHGLLCPRPLVPEEVARPKGYGDTIIVRYADDFVVGCQRKADAERFLLDLRERMSQFALELHPDKTRLIEFGRFAMANRRARGERRPETFDFLGFTHYCRKTRNGGFGLGRNRLRSGSREP